MDTPKDTLKRLVDEMSDETFVLTQGTLGACSWGVYNADYDGQISCLAALTSSASFNRLLVLCSINRPEQSL